MALRKATRRERWAYRFDRLFSFHLFTQVALLVVSCLAVVLVAGWLFVLFVPREGMSLTEGMWANWSYVLDPSAHASEEESQARWIGLAVSAFGLVIFFALIAVINEAVIERLDALKKGRSKVIETGHTVILGWSEKVAPIVRQLALANESNGGGVVCVLGNREKEEMQDAISDAVRDLHGTRVVCRTGQSWDLSDLEKVSVAEARSIIVLADENHPEQSDGNAIRTGLALRKALDGTSAHAVVEVCRGENVDPIRTVDPGRLVPVVAHDVIGRLMIQSARQNGLPQVVDSLLDFGGCEFYLSRWPSLVGKSYDEARRSFPTAVVCGLKQGSGETAHVRVAPPGDTLLLPQDELIVIAEDNDAYAPATASTAAPGPPPAFAPDPPVSERILLVGWRRDLGEMLATLDDFVAPKSEAVVLATLPIAEREAVLDAAVSLRQLTIRHIEGNPISRRELEALSPETFDSVLILADEGFEDQDLADSASLACLVLIRDILDRAGASEINVVAEIKDPRTKDLVVLARVSDYVVSNEVVAKYLTQVSERQDIGLVLGELFDAGGYELYLKDQRRYLSTGEPLSFRDLEVRAHALHEVLLGYRRAADGAIVLNPKDKLSPLPLSPSDLLVVLAESMH